MLELHVFLLLLTYLFRGRWLWCDCWMDVMVPRMCSSESSDVCCEEKLLMICPFLSSLSSQPAFVRTCLHSLFFFLLLFDVMLALLVLSSGSRLWAADSNNRVINLLFSYRRSCSSDYTCNIHNVSSVFLFSSAPSCL